MSLGRIKLAKIKLRSIGNTGSVRRIGSPTGETKCRDEHNELLSRDYYLPLLSRDDKSYRVNFRIKKQYRRGKI